MWARTLLVLVACIRSRRGWPHRVDLGLAQSVEDLPVEQLIAKAGVEALDVAVLPRASGLGADNRDPFLHGHLGSSGPQVVEWIILRSDRNGAGSARYATFIAANPSWPSLAMFRRRAEALRSAVAPAARCKNLRRGNFMAASPSRLFIRSPRRSGRAASAARRGRAPSRS